MANPHGASETSVQNFIHSLEQGPFAAIMRVVLLCVGVLAIALAYMGWNFSGFSIPEAMDQAQVAREIGRGHGFSTNFIRPLAIWQIEKNIGSAPGDRFPDTYNAPLPPLINALPVKAAGNPKYDRGVYIATAERAIVIVSMGCFILAVLLNYFLLKRLFDQRLAFLATLAVLVSDLCWQYTLSGLPQMLMLLLFTVALYAFARAIEAHAAPAPGSAAPAEAMPARSRAGVAVMGWLALSGLAMGLMMLCHAVAGWIAVGALIFAFAHFRRRGPVALVFLLTLTLVYTPWVVRTYQVSGSPFGIAGYAIFDGINGSTFSRMRSIDGPNVDEIAPLTFRLKVEHGIVTQMNNILDNAGGNILAILFFVSLIFTFRRVETGVLKWAVLLMWGCALFGMAILGPGATAIAPGQMGVLFLPIMVGFGVAMALVLFGRMEASNRSLLRVAFSGILLLVSAAPMIVTLLPERKPPHNFPPYFEPAIHSLNAWTSEKEIIASDMPWAVAFYGDRKSLWIPNRLRDLLGMSDQGKLSGELAGVFLSPISRGAPFISGIYKGEYQEYGQLIFGNVNIPYFPFREVVLPAGDLNYSFYSNSRRWERKQQPQ